MATATISFTPLSLEERAVVSRVVDAAPTLRPATVAEISALLGGAR
ncbi:hypothetical protein J2D78_09845 [Microbacterium maritypicum]|nr:hypothetical protein [Microbacterium liquefaciens]MBP5802384.1 hypothetical protein [Microbacterium liquefaciens]